MPVDQVPGICAAELGECTALVTAGESSFVRFDRHGKVRTGSDSDNNLEWGPTVTHVRAFQGSDRPLTEVRWTAYDEIGTAERPHIGQLVVVDMVSDVIASPDTRSIEIDTEPIDHSYFLGCTYEDVRPEDQEDWVSLGGYLIIPTTGLDFGGYDFPIRDDYSESDLLQATPDELKQILEWWDLDTQLTGTRAIQAILLAQDQPRNEVKTPLSSDDEWGEDLAIRDDYSESDLLQATPDELKQILEWWDLDTQLTGTRAIQAILLIQMQYDLAPERSGSETDVWVVDDEEDASLSHTNLVMGFFLETQELISLNEEFDGNARCVDEIIVRLNWRTVPEPN